MILDLVTLCGFVLIMTIGLRILARALRQSRRGGELRCGGCGVEAFQIEDFVCRVCGRDVRHCGLVPAGDRKGVTTLESCTTLTCLLVVAAAAITGIVAAGFRGDHWRSASQVYKAADPAIDIIMFDLKGAHDLTTATANVITKSGRAALIDIAAPELKCSLLAGDGVIVKKDIPFEVEAVREWLALAGLDANAAPTEQMARDFYFQMMLEFGIRVDSKMPNLVRPASLIAGSATGASGIGEIPRWVQRASLLFWPALWLLGIRKLAQPRMRRRELVVDEIALER